MLSDGQEVGSTISRESAVDALQSSQIRTYPVGLQSYPLMPANLETSPRRRGTYAEAAVVEGPRRHLQRARLPILDEDLVRYRSAAAPGEKRGGRDRNRRRVCDRLVRHASDRYRRAFEKSLWDRIIQSWLLIPLVVFGVLALAVYAIRSLLASRSTSRFRARLGTFVDMDPEERARRRRREVAELLALGPDRRSRIDWRPLQGVADDLEVADVRMPLELCLPGPALGMLVLVVLSGSSIGPVWVLSRAGGSVRRSHGGQAARDCDPAGVRRPAPRTWR